MCAVADESGPTEKDGQGEKKDPPRRRRGLPPARKTAYAAIGTALSVVMITIAAWLPVTIAPLVLVSVCWNIVADKCGTLWALLTIAASLALGFLCSALNVVVLALVAVAFVPYSLLCMLLRRFVYGGVRHTVVRIVCVSALAALEVLALYFVCGALAGAADYADIAGLAETLGAGNFALGYAMLTLVAVVIFVLVDFMYVRFVRALVGKLK